MALVTYILASLAIVATFLYYYFIRKIHYWRDRNVPHPKPLPVIGNVLPVLKGKMNVGQLLEKLYNEFDAPYFGIHMFNTPYLVLKDPNLIKQVLMKDFSKFSNRTFAANENVDPITYNTLFSMPNPGWKLLRSKLTPAFSSGKIKLMFPLIQECAEQLVSYLQTLSGKRLEIKSVCTRYTTQAISSCAFGINANCFKDEDSVFLWAGRRIFATNLTRALSATAYFFAPMFVNIFRLKFIDVAAVDTLGKIFWDVVHERERSKIRRSDLIDLLLDLKAGEKESDQYKLNDVRMLAQAITFFTAGHESTSTAITMTAYELGLHKDIQEKLRQEIRLTEQKYGDITYEAMQDMKYLDMVCCESLRMYPVATFLNRENLEPYTIESTGLVLEKSTPIMVSISGLHFDEKRFPEPHKFDPERFAGDLKKEIISSGYYQPFGSGPRNCIGDRFGLLALKIALINIIKNFEVELCSDTPVPLKFSTRSTLLAVEDGVHLTLRSI